MGRTTIFWLVGAVGSGIWCAIAVYWWRKAVDDATLVDDIVHASRYDAEMADYDSDHLIPLAL